MKKLFFSLSIIAISFVSCKKETRTSSPIQNAAVSSPAISKEEKQRMMPYYWWSIQSKNYYTKASFIDYLGAKEGC